jgi:hypothetical protein
LFGRWKWNVRSGISAHLKNSGNFEWRSISPIMNRRVVRLRRRTLIFLAAMGPGIITMIADNDAGGISTYAQTAARDRI